jgi:hypothetical protein
MNKIITFIVNIILIYISWHVLIKILGFFGLKEEIYGIYIAWFLVIWLFSTFLPIRVGKMFYDMDLN